MMGAFVQKTSSDIHWIVFRQICSLFFCLLTLHLSACWIVLMLIYLFLKLLSLRLNAEEEKTFLLWKDLLKKSFISMFISNSFQLLFLLIDWMLERLTLREMLWLKPQSTVRVHCWFDTLQIIGYFCSIAFQEHSHLCFTKPYLFQVVTNEK